MKNYENPDLLKLYNICETGNIEALAEIEEGLSTLLKIPNRGENSPLIIAADSCFPDIVKILIKHGVDVNYRTDLGETALDVACVSGDLESVNVLLKNGANPMSLDRFGVSVLERAQDSESDEIIKVIQNAIHNEKSKRTKKDTLKYTQKNGHQ
jgi:ankyrin repeat protein